MGRAERHFRHRDVWAYKWSSFFLISFFFSFHCPFSFCQLAQRRGARYYHSIKSHRNSFDSGEYKGFINNVSKIINIYIMIHIHKYVEKIFTKRKPYKHQYVMHLKGIKIEVWASWFLIFLLFQAAQWRVINDWFVYFSNHWHLTKSYKKKIVFFKILPLTRNILLCSP